MICASLSTFCAVVWLWHRGDLLGEKCIQRGEEKKRRSIWSLGVETLLRREFFVRF